MENSCASLYEWVKRNSPNRLRVWNKPPLIKYSAVVIAYGKKYILYHPIYSKSIWDAKQQVIKWCNKHGITPDYIYINKWC